MVARNPRIKGRGVPDPYRRVIYHTDIDFRELVEQVKVTGSCYSYLVQYRDDLRRTASNNITTNECKCGVKFVLEWLFRNLCPNGSL
jgi:hypothetical protein